jgi:hypothetical protein
MPSRQPHPHTPMSAAIPCTRASVQRLAIRSVRCKRFASTETVALEPAEPILPAKVEQRSTWKPDLSQRLHKALNPDLYRNGEPKLESLRTSIRRKQPKKPIDARWQPVMQQKTVNRALSMSTLPAFKTIQLQLLCQINLYIVAALTPSQATNSASQSSSPQPSTSRKPVPTPSKP